MRRTSSRHALLILAAVAALLLLGAACGNNGNSGRNNNSGFFPPAPPPTVARPDLPPLTQAPPLVTIPSGRSTQPPATRPAQTTVSLAACSLLTTADAAAALNAVGGRTPPSDAPQELNNGGRCIFGGGGEYVAIDFVRTASRDQFDPALRSFAQTLANSDPQIMASPVLMGVGRTYNAALVFARMRPQDGVFFVLVNGGYLQMTVRSASAVPSLQTILPAVDALAQRAIAHGGFLPG
jgi:hypothetical protein